IAHTQTEQTTSPSIVNLTTQWACQNSAKIDRSEDVSGSTCCATSAGFMSIPSRLSGLRRATGAALEVTADPKALPQRTLARCLDVSSFAKPIPGRHRPGTESREI